MKPLFTGKKCKFFESLFLKLYLWIARAQDPEIFTDQGWNMKALIPHVPLFQVEPQTPFKSHLLIGLLVPAAPPIGPLWGSSLTQREIDSVS